MKTILKIVLLLIAIVVAGFALRFGPMFIMELPRTNFQKNLKKRASAEELHAWAMQTLSPYQTNRDPALWIELTNLPSAFHGLHKWKSSAYIYGDSQTRFDGTEPIAYIKITYGSAAGHYGVVFGPTNLPTPISREHEIRYTTWMPGAWFFDEQ